LHTPNRVRIFKRMAGNLASLLHTARVARGLRQIDVAAAVETSQASVCRWERGSHEPSTTFLARLAELLDLPELVGG
jgi:transcriptional regulator with XRE-family HTH domain